MREYQNWGPVEGQMNLDDALDEIEGAVEDFIARELWLAEQDRRRFDVIWWRPQSASVAGRSTWGRNALTASSCAASASTASPWTTWRGP